MSAKDYLKQAYNIDRILRSKLEQIERLESLSVSASQKIDTIGGSAPHDNTKGSKVENMVVDIVVLKEEAQKQTAKLVAKRLEITKTIAAVGNLTLQYILEERYLLYKSWDEVRSESGFSKDYLYRLHREALRIVERLIA